MASTSSHESCRKCHGALSVQDVNHSLASIVEQHGEQRTNHLRIVTVMNQRDWYKRLPLPQAAGAPDTHWSAPCGATGGREHPGSTAMGAGYWRTGLNLPLSEFRVSPVYP
jgi:hypothetical protein